MKWPKLRELKEAVTAVLNGPYTLPFPAEATPLPTKIRGKPIYDADGCLGCGACAEVCPVRAIEIRDVEQASDVEQPGGSRVRRLTLHVDICVFCGECIRNCTTGEGIHFSSEYELSALSREEMVEVVEKELVPCELCGNAIAPRAHLLWIADKLGALAASNTTVFLTAQEELGLRESLPRDDRPIDRSDIQRVLCSACRRSVTLLDEWGPVA